MHTCVHQTSGSELQPRKVESTHAHSKEHDYRKSLHITMEPVFIPMKTSLVAVIFIS